MILFVTKTFIAEAEKQMESKIQNIAIIPARGGSKGLPNKNILPFNGKPLIAWSIEQALTSNLIERVIVSTDCEEIANIAIKFGAEVPGLRPPEISTDHASTEDVLLYVCNQLFSKSFNFKNVVLLQCTSPIRMPGTIDRAIQQFMDSRCDSLLSVTESHRFFWHDKTNPKPDYDFRRRPRRQDLKKHQIKFMETGSIYITKMKELICSKNRLCGSLSLFETDLVESFEIDGSLDFELCQFLAQKVLSREDNQYR